MIRFPNPGSNISAFVRTFQALFSSLREQPSFSLDNISRSLVISNLATSSGHIGQEALRRSTRTDRSLDPLFNQSKMYSELFRILGWIHPIPTSKQSFVFSYLGAHIGMAAGEPTQLVKECLLGIAYPNPAVVIKGANMVRPIPFIISTTAALDGQISRDEMIVGPMNIEDDRQIADIDAMTRKLKQLRRSHGSLEEALETTAANLAIQVNTLHNYTRFPIGVLRWAGWTSSQRDAGVYDALTEEGFRLANWIKDSYDVRARDLTKFSRQEVDNFIKVSTYRMLERAGYSLSDLPESMEELENNCRSLLKALGIADTTHILFSPFQEIEAQSIESVFPAINGSVDTDINVAHDDSVSYTVFGRPVTEEKGHVGLKQVFDPITPKEYKSNIIDSIFNYTTENGISLDQIIEKVAHDYRGTAKDVFYPAVETLFCSLGNDCECSRVGVNYQRMDALIRHPIDSIPIEIKSPAEQQYISVKGVRQALENKIVLLARKYAASHWETTSIVVGYDLPADRSEVMNLVDDIYKTYGIAIGIVDFRTLVRLAVIRLLFDRKPKEEEFSTFKGVIEISDA
jgi:hypothetical protein